MFHFFTDEEHVKQMTMQRSSLAVIFLSIISQSVGLNISDLSTSDYSILEPSENITTLLSDSDVTENIIEDEVEDDVELDDSATAPVDTGRRKGEVANHLIIIIANIKFTAKQDCNKSVSHKT